MNRLATATDVPAWSPVLEGLGLLPGDHGAPHQNGRIRFSVRSGWGTFESKLRRSDRLRGQLGQAGLWKACTDAQGTMRRVFELPPSILALAESDPDRFKEVAGWALLTVGGKADRKWSPPTQAEVEDWLPDKALTLQVGTIARQGTLILNDDRLTLGFCIVLEIPRNLSAARKAWLRELLADAQNRWRLVRIGLVGHSAQAEVDLTGAPHEALEELVRVGIDALRLVVSLLVEPADFLVNGAEGCRAVEVWPNRA